MSKNRKSQRTRNEILDEAWALIAAEGADVSLGRIAEAAGVTRQSVYVHFGSRGGLLMALVHRADERFGIRAAMESALAQADCCQRLDACLAVWLDFVPEIHPVASELLRLKATDEEASAAWNDRMAELLAVLRAVTGEIQRQGRLKEDWDADRAADYIWAAASLQVWQLLSGDRGWSQKTISEVIRRELLRAICR